MVFEIIQKAKGNPIPSNNYNKFCTALTDRNMQNMLYYIISFFYIIFPIH